LRDKTKAPLSLVTGGGPTVTPVQARTAFFPTWFFAVYQHYRYHPHPPPRHPASSRARRSPPPSCRAGCPHHMCHPTWSFVLQPANWPPASPPAATRQRLVTPSPPPLRRPTSTSSVTVVIVVHRRHRRLAASSVTRQPQPESVSSFPSVEVVRQLCFRRGEGAPEPSTSGNRSSLTCPYSRQRPRVSPHNRTIDPHITRPGRMCSCHQRDEAPPGPIAALPGHIAH
jgi:hypothetical protein